ncbi:hypothetical protein B0H10DRAFT_2214622 [Mycena sp. CBHHK59/15]|nr:hypothetical protein B0H10DRAFT_2214622 [Mycena sp. CBHHK59/15]
MPKIPGDDGGKKRQLSGLAAEVAWSIPVKEANDLGGKVPFVPGMPVFCTENIATELGISNGSPGTLISIVYEEIEDGVVLGTRFLFTPECEYSDAQKKALVQTDLGATVRTITYDEVGRTNGWPPNFDGRAISNQVTTDY